MSTPVDQSQIDLARANLKTAIELYQEKGSLYKLTLPDESGHVDRKDNPHGLNASSPGIDLGKVVNGPEATEEEVEVGASNAMYALPGDVRSVYRKRLKSLGGFGFRSADLNPTGGIVSLTWNALRDTATGELTATNSRVRNLVLLTDTTVNLPPPVHDNTVREVIFLVKQPTTPVNLTVTQPASTIWWKGDIVGVEWSTWTSVTLTFAEQVDADQAKAAIDAGTHDTRLKEYRNAQTPVDNNGSWEVATEIRTRSYTKAFQGDHWYRIKTTSIGDNLYINVEDIGAINENFITASTLDASRNDSTVTVGTPRHGYLGTLIEQSNIASLRDFTPELLLAANLPGDVVGDPLSVTWERTMWHGRVVYVPSAPLVSNVSWDELDAAGLIDGKKLFTIQSVVGGLADDGYVTFSVVTPSVEERHHLLYPFLDPKVDGYNGPSFGTHAPSDFGLGNPEATLEWTRDLLGTGSNDAIACGSPDPLLYATQALVTRGTKTSTMGWRPFLIPLYARQTT